MINEKTIEQVKRHEGFRRHPYYCTAKKFTIGYGRNLDDVGITEEEAGELLKNDITECQAGVNKNISVDLCNPARVGVLVNMAYNLGLKGLMAFSKMIAKVEKGDFNGAAEEMLDSRWAQQVPNRAQSLALQMQTGEWQ